MLMRLTLGSPRTHIIAVQIGQLGIGVGIAHRAYQGHSKNHPGPGLSRNPVSVAVAADCFSASCGLSKIGRRSLHKELILEGGFAHKLTRKSGGGVVGCVARCLPCAPARARNHGASDSDSSIPASGSTTIRATMKPRMRPQITLRYIGIGRLEEKASSIFLTNSEPFRRQSTIPFLLRQFIAEESTAPPDRVEQFSLPCLVYQPWQKFSRTRRRKKPSTYKGATEAKGVQESSRKQVVMEATGDVC